MVCIVSWGVDPTRVHTPLNIAPIVVARQMFLSFTLGLVLQTLLMTARYIAMTAMFARNIDMIIDVPPAKRMNFLSLPPDTRITTLPIF